MGPEAGKIVRNLVADEPVKIIKVQPLGSKVSITYSGINTKIESQRVIDRETYNSLEVVTEEGSFNFKGNPEHFLLYAEAERIHSAYQFDPLFAVNCSIVDPLPHQVEAVYKYLLPQPKIRFLLADDTGAGKTIMTGLLLKEMMMRGLVQRVLIITPGGLTRQWLEDEMALKFNLHFRLADRGAFRSDPNIFTNTNMLITSIDFIRNEDIINVAKETSWDIIVVDEAHKLSAFDYGTKRYVSKRYQAMEMLAAKCEHLLLLTATPHRGRTDTFRNLLQLLDEDVFASDSMVTSRIREIGDTGVNKFFIRRLKEQMKDWDGAELFKKRITTTTTYELTPEEKALYEAVTAYLTEKRGEAEVASNIHVTLALMIMQRRLTSSIYAIKNTLEKRYNALKNLLDELARNPNLWNQKAKLEDFNCQTLDDFEEYDDKDRDSLEKIFADPRQFRLFTTAKSPADIRLEASQVQGLMEMAAHLYNTNQEEQKYKKLCELLQTQGVLDKSEKLVIFTEYRDTLDYLEQRLTNNGYKVVTIHGLKKMEHRREAQLLFAGEDAQILIATDAAGEGINLQFCRLLINWDIPWNPNRLEQRMGRIHRYGQKSDVLVYNMVAANTREGEVLIRLLQKLDSIREQMGDDRVYDVISDVFEKVGLDDILKATFTGEANEYDEAIETSLTKDVVAQKIKEQKERLNCSSVNYEDTRLLKDDSDEKRLQPIYIRQFFEKAFSGLGGTFEIYRESIFEIRVMPEKVVKVLKEDYSRTLDYKAIQCCFDKQEFLDFQHASSPLHKMYYINPGNYLFDSLVKVVLKEYKEDMLQGTVLVSPNDRHSHYAYYVKSQVTDHRPHKENDSIADECLRMVMENSDGEYMATSPAKFVDLRPPSEFAINMAPPESVNTAEVMDWSFVNITEPQYQETVRRVKEDAEKRKEYLVESFTKSIADVVCEINDLQAKILTQPSNTAKIKEKITRFNERIERLKIKREARMEVLERMMKLDMKPPQIMGCAYVVPLKDMEYSDHFGMSRDDEVEAVAMEVAMAYERSQGWTPEDVSKDNIGFDIRSVGPDLIKRYIEVKGRARVDGVMLSENEMNRLEQLHDTAWLYIVVNCKTKPELFRFQDPCANLRFQKKTKGVQYYLPLQEWKSKVKHDK